MKAALGELVIFRKLVGKAIALNGLHRNKFFLTANLLQSDAMVHEPALLLEDAI